MHDDHTTIFSTAEFVNSWCRAFGDCEPFAVRVQGSGPSRTMHVVKAPLRYASWKLSGPRANDLWTSPGWTGELNRSTVEDILQQMKGMRTRSLQWQVRFDHEALANILSSLGLVQTRVQIHILRLVGSYAYLFDHYNATARNHVRKAARRGVTVRSTCNAKDILAYHAIYSKHAEKKSWEFEYPAKLTLELVKMSGNACFLVAQYGEEVIGGALFLRDGNSVYYLHGVADRDYGHLFPASAIIDSGIRWACEIGADFFNFGNSGIGSINESLSRFKSSWGAHVEHNWLFDWNNPLWKSAAKFKSEMLLIRLNNVTDS